MVAFEFGLQPQQFLCPAAEVRPGDAQLPQILPASELFQQGGPGLIFPGVEHEGAGAGFPEQNRAPFGREDLGVVPADGFDHADVEQHFFIEVLECLGIHGQTSLLVLTGRLHRRRGQVFF